MRTRILPKMLNEEVEEYLSRNDIIIVPVGTVEMHGGFPLDCETTISEAYAVKMAEACDGLVLTGLPYFYAGATASGRGTVQVSVREGIDYLGAIARNLLRLGFKRQIYISFHGPAHMTCSPMIRDFMDETGVPILYMDMTMHVMKTAKDLFKSMDSFHAISVGAYKIMNRVEDVPLTTKYTHTNPQSCSKFDDIFGMAYQSGSIGYYFKEQGDHMSTTAIPDVETRDRLATEGAELIEQMVERMNLTHVVEQMRKLEEYNKEVEEKCPWVPSNFNKSKKEVAMSTI